MKKQQNSGYKGTLLARAKRAYKEEGIYSVISYQIIKLFARPMHYYYKIFKPSRTFTFKGKTYNYFYHRYNTTWRNERAVEVPIIWEIVTRSKSKRMHILEVGNVLSHYFPIQHDVLDQYEKAHGVINQDVVDFQPSKKYDLIVSISTLEHVGWDEEPRDSEKILRALENLETNCLIAGGKIVVTLPLGSNTEMDRLLREGKMRFTKQEYLKRVSVDNEWIEVDWDEVKEVKRNDPFPAANGLLIGIVERENTER